MTEEDRAWLTGLTTRVHSDELFEKFLNASMSQSFLEARRALMAGRVEVVPLPRTIPDVQRPEQPRAPPEEEEELARGQAEQRQAEQFLREEREAREREAAAQGEEQH